MSVEKTADVQTSTTTSEAPFLKRLQRAASTEFIILGGATAGSGAVLFFGLLDRTALNPAVTVTMIPVGMLIYTIGKILEEEN
jgi:glycerol uptake facilitator-like aquaporin